MITLADLKAYLGIAPGDTSQDTRLQLFVDATNQYVEDKTLYNYGNDKTRSEILDYRDNVMLGRMGIKSITEVRLYQRGTEDETDPIDTKSYTYDSNTGRLTLDFSYGDDYNRSAYNAVHVTYVYGHAEGETMPADLKLAALQFAADQLSGTGGQDSRRVKSESTGSYRIEFSDTGVFDNVIAKYTPPKVG